MASHVDLKDAKAATANTSLDMISSSHIGSDAGRSSETDSNAPEVLVRNDNKVVNGIRLVAVVALLATTVVTSYLVFRFTRDAQETYFVEKFDSVSSKVVTNFETDLSLKFWMAKTLVEAVSAIMDSTYSTASKFSLQQGAWEKLTKESTVQGKVHMASWNPLLRSDEERVEFEAMVQDVEITVGPFDPCYLCGSPDLTYSNPDGEVQTPGFGVYTCGQLEILGRQGVMQASNCGFISEVAGLSCECVDLPDDAVVPDNLADVPDWIFKFNDTEGELVMEPYANPPYLPIWNIALRDVKELPVMYNLLAESLWNRDIEKMLDAEVPVMSEIFIRSGPYYETYAGYANEPGSVLHFPVFSNQDTIVGTIAFDIRWSTFVTTVFPTLSELVDIVVENTCGQSFTFFVDPDDETIILKGEGDLHDPEFSELHASTSYESFDRLITIVTARTPPEGAGTDYCRYRFHAYATRQFEEEHLDSQPIIMALVTAFIFVITALIFLAYDFVVARRQRKVMDSANKTNAIVSSLFPKNVRDRIFEQNCGSGGSNRILRGTKTKMHSFLKGESKELVSTAAAPIADLFASATVGFLDIAGFTAWSSEREPAQVFQLLEGVYQGFDEVARKLGVFKVETIGDSYVAVCGLPNQRDGHAPVMVVFAERCLKSMTKVTRGLEIYLGPSTGDLKARVGLHSGPVTAGVLRGEKARFQLFGDTMNTASRMEKSGKPGRIHVTQATVDLLEQAGKSLWVHKREEKVTLKGKGELQTYWVSSNVMATTPSIDSAEESPRHIDPSGSIRRAIKESRNVVHRLVDWNVEIVYIHLERIMLMRQQKKLTAGGPKKMDLVELSRQEEYIVEDHANGKIVMDEMTEVLSLLGFDTEYDWDSSAMDKTEPEVNVALVKGQLRDYILRIARLYRDVPFHNFEHVSHVVMSASKLMNRIVNPDDVDYHQDPKRVARDIHDMTFGVSSDPLLQFSVVFACLIHDVDHTGLTNAELNAMETEESVRYRQKSVAEQNSVDIAWGILMESKYKELRKCIYQDTDELYRFRQAVVNAVMATDIADKTLKANRESRWNMAFSEVEEVKSELSINRKATIVFEYIIQASDVAHTMQHWHTYQKFNRRLFEERYLAWMNGHAEKDPSEGWYGGELWFFDNYIIPTANKLDKCGVFGVSYDEYVTYASENRKEWEAKGKDIVKEMKSSCEKKYAAELEQP